MTSPFRMPRTHAAIAFVAAALALPAAVGAQALQCAVPRLPPRPHPDLATPTQPMRIVPIGGYTLALTWSPQYCRDRARDPAARFQCGDNRFGFTLHGLWPDGTGPEWPQYCRRTALLPPPVIRGMLCTTPSAQLLQHEWAKHGTCMPGITPAQYFTRSRGLFAGLRFPVMNALSRAPLTAGRLATAIARANPGLDADMMRVTATKDGWLDEIWLCLDTRFRYARCAPHAGGVAPSAPIRIWRGQAR